MTILLILVLLALFWLSGLGMTLLLFRQPEEAPRLVISPLLGIAVGVLLFFPLLTLNLDGPSTARLEIALLAGLAGVGLWRSRLTREDWLEARPALAACCLTLIVTVWPLLWAGYQDYMGYGNPDVPFFITYIRFFTNNAFQLPDPEYFRGLAPGGFLGVLTYIFQLATVTGTEPARLFATLCGGIVILGPAAVYVLCRLGLGFGRGRSGLIAFIAAVSAPPAFTFYLHSMGALTVVITVPIALAASLSFLKTLKLRDAFLLSLLIAGALYNYGPGLAIILPVCGGALGVGLLQRRIPLRTAALALGIFLVTVAGPCLPYLKGVYLTIRGLSSQSRLDARVDEIQTAFALVLTERVIPFFWGLNNPYLPIPRWIGGFYPLQVILYSSALLFFLIAVLAAVNRISKLSAAFGGALAGGAAVLAYYQYNQFGYGIFKLVAWENLLFVTAFAGCATSMILRYQHNGLRTGLVALLALFAGLNTAHTIHLGRYSAGLDGALLSSTPNYKLSDFEAVKSIPKVDSLMVGVPDIVARSWAAAFYGVIEPNKPSEILAVNRGFNQMGSLGLLVEDSTPIAYSDTCKASGDGTELRRYELTCADLDAKYFLNWTNGVDLVGTSSRGVWSSRLFVMVRGVPANTLLIGRGWYRPEKVPDSEVGWQRNTFRWIRKRAELYVIHPTPAPKRLKLGLVAGFGISASMRHIDLILNGKRLQTIEMTGLRELVTEPFVIPGPASQLELAITETVAPQKRGGALWNKWVPSDSRSLNVAVRRLELIDSDAPETTTLPSEIDFEVDAGDWGNNGTDGVYQDRWIGRRAQVELAVPPGARYLEFNGFVPGVKALAFPFRVAFSADHKAVGWGEITAPGYFQMKIPLPAPMAATRSSVGIEVPATFRPSEAGNSPDTRDLSIRVKSLGFKR